MKILKTTLDKCKIGDVIEIYVYSDVHCGSKLVNNDLVRTGFNFMKLSGNKKIMIDLGDKGDFINLKDKRASNEIDYSDGESIVNEQIETYVNSLKGINVVDKIMIRGNHEKSFSKYNGFDPHRQIVTMCDALDGSEVCFYNLMIPLYRDRPNYSFNFYLIHGAGGLGKSHGAVKNKLHEYFHNINADFCMFGHFHKAESLELERIECNNEKVIAKPMTCLAGGTFMSKYGDNVNGYFETRASTLPSIGFWKITIELAREKEKCQINKEFINLTNKRLL